MMKKKKKKKKKKQRKVFTHTKNQEHTPFPHLPPCALHTIAAYGAANHVVLSLGDPGAGAGVRCRMKRTVRGRP